MSDSLPKIGRGPCGNKSPVLNDLQRQSKESSVARLRKTVKAQQQLPTSDSNSAKKYDGDDKVGNSETKFKNSRFEDTNPIHLIEKNNPWTLNDVMSILSNERIEYEYEVLENNDIKISVKSNVFNPRQMQVISQINFDMDISGNLSKIIRF